MAAYILTDGVTNQVASTPWAADLDGMTIGFFVAARVRTVDITGSGDEQAIHNMWRGPATTSATWFLMLQPLGTFALFVKETALTEATAISADISAAPPVGQGVNDNDDFWIGASAEFPLPLLDIEVQYYFGGFGGVPTWATWGALLTGLGGVDDMRTDPLNDLFAGITRNGSGPADHWNGRLYETVYFNRPFPDIGAGSLISWLDGSRWSVGDGTTDTMVEDTPAARTWTLSGAAAMIFDDAGVATGSTTWWIPPVAAPGAQGHRRPMARR